MWKSVQDRATLIKQYLRTAGNSPSSRRPWMETKFGHEWTHTACNIYFMLTVQPINCAPQASLSAPNLARAPTTGRWRWRPFWTCWTPERSHCTPEYEYIQVAMLMLTWRPNRAINAYSLSGPFLSPLENNILPIYPRSIHQAFVRGGRGHYIIVFDNSSCVVVKMPIRLRLHKIYNLILSSYFMWWICSSEMVYSSVIRLSLIADRIMTCFCSATSMTLSGRSRPQISATSWTVKLLSGTTSPSPRGFFTITGVESPPKCWTCRIPGYSRVTKCELNCNFDKPNYIHITNPFKGAVFPFHDWKVVIRDCFQL